jgi:hypothetical protein
VVTEPEQKPEQRKTEIWLPRPSTVRVWVREGEVVMDASTLDFELQDTTPRFFGKPNE